MNKTTTATLIFIAIISLSISFFTSNVFLILTPLWLVILFLISTPLLRKILGYLSAKAIMKEAKKRAIEKGTYVEHEKVIGFDEWYKNLNENNKQ